LGVLGGLSILGTSGIVRPFSGKALRDALKCALNVAAACRVTAPVFVPGRIGERAAKALFDLAREQLIEVSNEWGFMLDEAARIDFKGLLVLGHPGKLAKLPAGDWDTHSARSRNAVPTVMALGNEALGRELPESRTVEGLFAALPDEHRGLLADRLAASIGKAVSQRINDRFPVAVVLVNLSGAILGINGDLGLWRKQDA
jgi:cobalt-precorrin-5B (C1)-methyltransferase